MTAPREDASRLRYVEGVLLPEFFKSQNITDAMRYKAHDNDLIVATYPKSGTTWMQHIVLNLQRLGSFDGDVNEVHQLCPFIELSGVSSLNPGSFYKTHLPFNEKTFNPNAKYILVFRNPRDVAVSFYYHARGLPSSTTGVPEGVDWFLPYIKLFISDSFWYGDYFKHVLGWLDGVRKFGKPENVLIVVYEKMKTDPRNGVIRVANFLGGEYAEMIKNEEVLREILELTSVESMRKRINSGMKRRMEEIAAPTDKLADLEFIRKGEVGDHVNHFTPEISEMFEEWIATTPRSEEVMNLFENH